MSGKENGLERFWRIVATAICFTTFGLGGLMLWLVVFPVLFVLVRNTEQRARWARAIIRSTWFMFIRMMFRLGIYTYEFKGIEKLRRQGLLILANHPSLIDVVFLVSHISHADCIVKGALANNPFTRGPVRAAQYICNDSGEGLVEDCIASLEAGYNLIIFPEGTRTRPGQPLSLQRGAAQVAVRGARNITPVIIHCHPPMLVKGAKWYHVPPRRSHFVFRIENDIEVGQFIEKASGQALAARQLTDYLHQYFTKETASHAGTGN